jgi:hypothetical protein
MGAIGLIKRCKRSCNIVYITLASEDRSVDSAREDGGKIMLLQEVKKYDLCNICYTDSTGLFFNWRPNKNLTFHVGFCHVSAKSKG